MVVKDDHVKILSTDSGGTDSVMVCLPNVKAGESILFSKPPIDLYHRTDIVEMLQNVRYFDMRTQQIDITCMFTF